MQQSPRVYYVQYVLQDSKYLMLYCIASEQAYLRENWGKEKRKGEGGGGRERENEPAGMTFNLESLHTVSVC